MPFQLIYSSDATCDVEHEIEAVLEASRRNNPALGITGLLIYSDDIFSKS